MGVGSISYSIDVVVVVVVVVDEFWCCLCLDTSDFEMDMN